MAVALKQSTASQEIFLGVFVDEVAIFCVLGGMGLLRCDISSSRT